MLHINGVQVVRFRRTIAIKFRRTIAINVKFYLKVELSCLIPFKSAINDNLSFRLPFAFRLGPYNRVALLAARLGGGLKGVCYDCSSSQY